MIISIIVPIYNVQNYLEECIQSIINQTFTDLEIILIDDGSTDNSGIICDEYAVIDSRITVSHIENSGLSVARNEGLKIASGDYVMFLDGDDLITLNAVEGIVKVLETESNIDIVTGKMITYYNESSIKEEKFKIKNEKIINKSGEQVLTYYFDEIPNIIWSACRSIYRREFFLNNNFLFTPNLTSEDLDLIPLVYITARKIRAYNQPFYYYRQLRPNSIINTQCLKKFQDIIYIISKYEKLIDSGIYSDEFCFSFQKRLSNIYTSYLVLISEIDERTKKLALDSFEEKKYLLQYSYGFKNRFIKILVKLIGINRSSLIYVRIKKLIISFTQVNFQGEIL